MTSNEIRAEIGMKPSKAEQAESLSNPNISQSGAQNAAAPMPEEGMDVAADESGGDEGEQLDVQDILQALSGGEESEDEET